MLVTFEHPIQWPEGIVYNFAPRRSRFGHHTLSQALSEVESELERFGADSMTLSADWSIGKNGRPLADLRNCCPVVVTYKRLGGEHTVAICEYDSLVDNLWAVAKVVESLRTMERHGGDAVTRQAESGFAALPRPDKRWWEVLGVTEDEDPVVVHAKYKALSKRLHPDVGGSEDAMLELNNAYATFKQEVRG